MTSASPPQPSTLMIETLPGLLLDVALGTDARAAVLWCVLLSLVGLLWSTSLYGRSRCADLVDVAPFSAPRS